jgi:N-acyl-D-aspartate/D-glutamate deacylase
MKYLVRLTITLLVLGTNASFAQEDSPPPQVLFKNVNIFNGTEDKLYENHQVLVEGNIIKAISAGEIEARDGATIIDGNGRTLMPGLIDSHVHLNLTGLFHSFDQAESVSQLRSGGIRALGCGRCNGGRQRARLPDGWIYHRT